VIDKDAHARDPIIAVGTHLGRVRRAATRARRVPPDHTLGCHRTSVEEIQELIESNDWPRKDNF
jgi:hypothetical protein